tara:strand:+ start:165 stop:842 length:678 start_codon:yes stop_codon:yes gene_type:complete
MKKSYFDKKLYKNMLNKNKNFVEKFGLDSNFKWQNDPKQFFISLSRYKFVSRILRGKKNVLEVGCADGFNSRIVKQSVKRLVISDSEYKFKEYFNKISNPKWNIKFILNDFEREKLKKKFDAIYSIDVLEHISPKKEHKFIKNIIFSLKNSGMLIVGMPSLEFQKYSRPSKISGHVNCKTEEKLKIFLEKYFENVVIFSMNDELVHTGFEKMSCYFFALCFQKKN